MVKEKVKRKKEKVGQERNGCSNYRASFYLLLFAFFLLSSCADTNRQPTSRPSSANERQDKALRDPFNYGPKEKDKYTDEDMPSVTGGSTGHFDKKAFNRDVDRVLNP